MVTSYSSAISEFGKASICVISPQSTDGLCNFIIQGKISPIELKNSKDLFNNQGGFFNWGKFVDSLSFKCNNQLQNIDTNIANYMLEDENGQSVDVDDSFISQSTINFKIFVNKDQLQLSIANDWLKHEMEINIGFCDWFRTVQLKCAKEKPMTTCYGCRQPLFRLERQVKIDDVVNVPHLYDVKVLIDNYIAICDDNNESSKFTQLQPCNRTVQFSQDLLLMVICHNEIRIWFELPSFPIL